MRRRIEDNESPDRWVVSYADFITLLFALFTTLYAISVVDTQKLGKFVNSLNSALGTEISEQGSAVIPELVKPSRISKRIESELRGVVGSFSRDLNVRRDERGVIVSLGEGSLFASGSVEIKESSLKVLAELSLILKGIPNKVLIEGHTDNLPVRSSRYNSNWEISTLRAVSVLRLFIEKFGLPPERFIVAGYGEYKPLRENTTHEGRAKNRRVDIVILTDREAKML
ncbi:Flagellar motor rotation protein MotB [hydrothermal vent metagenome]|uniref:Flagellar motor rotation protein MotB n=1 Tax=hydrothermal vent metagenome TaxID=652676 RepID=A0A3B1CLJ5_9ZZZZ